MFHTPQSATDRKAQVVDAEFVIELDGEESKLFKEMFAELLK